MKTKTALDHFGVSRCKLGSMIGITRSAVYQWGEVIPFWSAWKLVKVSDGELELGMNDYDDDGRIVLPTKSAAQAEVTTHQATVNGGQ